MATQQDEGFEERRSAFVQEIEGYLMGEEPQKAFETIHDLKNYEAFNASGYELIPIAGKYVTRKFKDEKPALFRCAVQMLDRISREFSPQETYLELLEQAEDGDDVKFCTMLDIIKYCLLRMPNQRGKSISWACDTIVRHLCNMDTPKSKDTDDDDDDGASLLFKKNCEVVRDISMVLEIIIAFFQPFVQDLQDTNCEVPADHKREYRDDIMKSLLKCLGRPLIHLNLSKDSDYFGLASSILDMVGVFVRDPFELLPQVDLSFGCVEQLECDAISTDFTNVSLGCYFYLIFDDEDRLQNISHVHSPKYLFECVMALAFDLLGTNEAPLILKALKLFHAVLGRIPSKTVEFNSIKDTVMSKFLEMLTRTMVYNEEKELRQLSVQIYPRFLGKFTPEGQYIVLYNANQLSSDPGFIGFCLTLVKDQVKEALDTKDQVSLRYFSGKRLIDLMSRYCRINGLIEADLQSHTDQIMSCLNLIRYILIRDKNNEADLWPFMASIDELYIEPVKNACLFARGMYEDCKANLHQSPDRRIQVDVVGFEELLPEMTPEEQIRHMNEKLTKVDMIDYLASRVSECLVEYKQNYQMLVQSS
uniref:Glomulin n=1 Tax=Lygus hesperus TaxID=30085 RepID=A0A0A9Z8W0_LYGHE